MVINVKINPKKSEIDHRISVRIADITKNLYPSWCNFGNILSNIINYNLIILG